MHYSLELNPRPFEAIKLGTKKIECRVPTEHNKDISFDKMKKGDTIRFINNVNGETLRVLVLGVKHYLSFRDLLESEGTKRVLSSGGNIEEGIVRLESFPCFESSMNVQFASIQLAV